jgi:hypothetical protein
MASHDPLLQPEELKRLITTTATKLPVSTARNNDLRLVAPEASAQAAIESAAARSARPSIPLILFETEGVEE